MHCTRRRQDSIQSAHCTLCSGPSKKVPQESFVPEQHIPLQVTNTILAACKLDKTVQRWDKLLSIIIP